MIYSVHFIHVINTIYGKQLKRALVMHNKCPQSSLFRYGIRFYG